MRRSAFTADPRSVASTAVAVRLGIVAWLAAAVVGLVIARLRGIDPWWWLLVCAVGVVCGLVGLLYLGRKARGR